MTPGVSLVSIVDFAPTVCAFLGKTLQRAGFHIEVATGPAMLSDFRARCAGPVCVVAGMTPGDPGAITKIERLRWAGMGAPIIVIITERADVGAAVAAMKAGAFDALVHPVQEDQFVATVARALDADAETLASGQRLNDVRRKYARLTARERDVLYAVTDGMLNKQAADRLGITEKTIKVHRASVMKKMGADSFAALVRMVDAQRQCPGQEHPWPAGDDPEVGAGRTHTAPSRDVTRHAG